MELEQMKDRLCSSDFEETIMKKQINKILLFFMILGMTAVSFGMTVSATGGTGDASLSFLEVSPGTLSPEFSSDQYEYNVEVGEDCDKLLVNAQTTDSGAKFVIAGNSGLKAGANSVIINVTAADGVTKAKYTIQVMRGLDGTSEGGSVNPGVGQSVGGGIASSPFIAGARTVPESQGTDGESQENGGGTTESAAAETEAPESDGAGSVQNNAAASGAVTLAGRTYQLSEPSEEILPNDFIPVEISIGGQTVKAWQFPSDSDISGLYLIYGSNPEGKTAFYIYDESEGMVITAAAGMLSIGQEGRIAQNQLRSVQETYQKSLKTRMMIIIGLSVLCFILVIALTASMTRKKHYVEDGYAGYQEKVFYDANSEPARKAYKVRSHEDDDSDDNESDMAEDDYGMDADDNYEFEDDYEDYSSYDDGYGADDEESGIQSIEDGGRRPEGAAKENRFYGADGTKGSESSDIALNGMGDMAERKKKLLTENKADSPEAESDFTLDDDTAPLPRLHGIENPEKADSVEAGLEEEYPVEAGLEEEALVEADSEDAGFVEAGLEEEYPVEAGLKEEYPVETDSEEATEEVGEEKKDSDDFGLEDIDLEIVSAENIESGDRASEDGEIFEMALSENAHLEEKNTEEDVPEESSQEERTLENTDLEEISFEESGLEEITIEDTDLEEIVLEDTGLEEISFEDTGLEEIIMEDHGYTEDVNGDSGLEETIAEGSALVESVAWDGDLEEVQLEKGSQEQGQAEDSGEEETEKTPEEGTEGQELMAAAGDHSLDVDDDLDADGGLDVDDDLDTDDDLDADFDLLDALLSDSVRNGKPDGANSIVNRAAAKAGRDLPEKKQEKKQEKKPLNPIRDTAAGNKRPRKENRP